MTQDGLSAKLTPRQLELAKHVALGMTNAEIAEVMGTAEQTAKNQCLIVARLLGVRNRVEIARKMILAGFTVSA